MPAVAIRTFDGEIVVIVAYIQSVRRPDILLMYVRGFPLPPILSFSSFFFPLVFCFRE